MGNGVLTLDRAQSLALARSTALSVTVCGFSGTGKSSLANAIAVQAAEAGLTCLLVGASPELERPLGYRLAHPCHPILAHRANIRNYPIVEPRAIDPIGARARLDPQAAQLALRILHRARELIETYGLGPDEVEHSLAAARPAPPEALDLLAVAAHDASRIADTLWSGNRRSGRSLRDIEMVISGNDPEVPPDEQPLALILLDDRAFEAKLAELIATEEPVEEINHLGAVVSALRSSAAAGRTLNEVYEHIIWTAQILRDAIDLVGIAGSPEAAAKAEPRTRASTVVELFVRKRPADGSAAAIEYFEGLLRQFENDRTALAPYLERQGTRSIASIAHPIIRKPQQFERPSAGAFVQKIREARYAARNLPGLMGQLQSHLAPPVMDRIRDVPIEEITNHAELSRVPDARTTAADELRQLRDLFASTGFGDVFTAPDDFVERQEALVAEPTLTPSGHRPELLDLLVEATLQSSPGVVSKIKEWPSSIVRIKTQRELAEIVSREVRFDVVVADDFDEFDPITVDQFAVAGTRVHRIGAGANADAIFLEVPHRQANCEIADLASCQSKHWLGGPDGLGVVVRENNGLPLDHLRSEATRLAERLQTVGGSTAIAPVPSHVVADIVVAATDELHNADLARLATSARGGVVVLCRRDLRQREPAPEWPLPADAITAQTLGWRINRVCAEGVLLEKSGRCAALVREPTTLTGSEQLVTDVVGHLSLLGWRPLVAWRDTPRDPAQLDKLLESHSVPAPTQEHLRVLVDGLGLSQIAAHSDDGQRAELPEEFRPAANEPYSPQVDREYALEPPTAEPWRTPFILSVDQHQVVQAVGKIAAGSIEALLLAAKGPDDAGLTTDGSLAHGVDPERSGTEPHVEVPSNPEPPTRLGTDSAIGGREIKINAITISADGLSPGGSVKIP